MLFDYHLAQSIAAERLQEAEQQRLVASLRQRKRRKRFRLMQWRDRERVPVRPGAPASVIG